MHIVLRSLYYLFRPIIPIEVRWFFQRRVATQINGFSTFPMWPLPELSSNPFTPHNNTKHNENNSFLSSLILTHDVDTQFGFDHIRDVCEVEKRLGFKSSWNIVPDLYEVDELLLEYLCDSGMEIGVHDWNHDGRLFSDKKIFDERVKKINRVIKRWGAKGFRAGMVFHNDEWMQQLECEYDSSYYDTDPFQPMGGGCGKIWPFMLGRLVELPYTMPQDHVLFVAGAEVRVPKEYHSEDKKRKENWEWMKKYVNNLWIKEKSEIVLKRVDVWKMKAEWLMERGGMVLMITHPDYLCHPKLRAKSMAQRAEHKCVYDGWLGDENKGQRSELKNRMVGRLDSGDGDVVEVRERGIVEAMWYGSLLEQYAAFLNWFKREFEGRYWHCLAYKLVHRFKEEERTVDHAD